MAGAAVPRSEARTTAAGLAGLRRVDWVRITVGGRQPHCEVSGVGHRLPVTRGIPPLLANALIALGIPHVVRHAAPAEAA